ncbi:MAG: sulfite exporter TauE/SafE family protein [Clostridia bacterium]|nr:sulfite exporter TauE/SafE family protein [Clostridia bacterium]
MLNKFSIKKHCKTVLLCILAFVAGGVNGFIGTGGGIVLVYSLSALTDNDKKDNLATALCVTIPISFLALFSYISGGNVDFQLLPTLIFPAVAGGLTGAFLTHKLSTKWLNLIFAILVIYSGFRLILR